MEILIYIIFYSVIASIVAFAIAYNLDMSRDDEDYNGYMLMSCFIGLMWPLVMVSLAIFLLCDALELLKKIIGK